MHDKIVFSRKYVRLGREKSKNLNFKILGLSRVGGKGV